MGGAGIRACYSGHYQAPLASDPPVSSSSTSPLISAARMRRASITSISITSICFFSVSYWVCRRGGQEVCHSAPSFSTTHTPEPQTMATCLPRADRGAGLVAKMPPVLGGSRWALECGSC